MKKNLRFCKIIHCAILIYEADGPGQWNNALDFSCKLELLNDGPHK